MRYRRTRLPGGTVFLTLVTFERRPMLQSPAAVERFHVAMRKVQAKRPFKIEAAVILPDHIHTLWTLPEGDVDYPDRVRLAKGYFSKTCAGDDAPAEPSASRRQKRERHIWQRRYWEHTIRDEHDFQAHVDYIHANPVRHGFVTAARDWPHSTFHDWVARGVYDTTWGTDALPELPERTGHE